MVADTLPAAPTAGRALSEYRPSGLASPMRLAAAIGLATAGAAIIGVVYTLLVFYIPFLKLRGLATFGAGFAIGGLVLWLIHLAHARSRLIGLGLALWSALVAYYVSWSVWPALAIDDPELGAGEVTWFFLTTPDMIVAFARSLLEEGFWLQRDDPVKGSFLAVIWIIEAAILFGTPLVLAFTQHGERPFCGACRSWCGNIAPAASLDANAPLDEVRRELLAGNLDVLRTLGPADFSASQRLRLERIGCRKCGESEFFTLWLVEFVEKNGAVQEHKQPVVRHLRLTPEQAQWIDEELAAARPISPTSEEAEEQDEPQNPAES